MLAIGQHRGGKKLRARIGQSLAADQYACAHGLGVMHMGLDFFHGFAVNQGANLYARGKAIARFERTDGGAHAAQKFVVDARLHQHAVGRDAGLAGVAKFLRHQTRHDHIQISIVKHQHGGIATQL